MQPVRHELSHRFSLPKTVEDGGGMFISWPAAVFPNVLLSTSMKIVQRSFFATAFVCACLLAPLPSRAGDKTLAIQATDNMKYDLTVIEAEAGQTINLTLTNAGKMPKIAMAHNLVILKPGTDVTAFVTAASHQSANGYLPIAEADRILVSTKLLGPGESDTIQFTPREPGTYDFVCTFPAHMLLGMRGTITVR